MQSLCVASIPEVLVYNNNKMVSYSYCLLLLQHLKSSLMEHQSKLYQVLDDGKRLLFSVTCLELETQLNQLGEHWLNNTSKVNKELNRLETILKHWTRYY